MQKIFITVFLVILIALPVSVFAKEQVTMDEQEFNQIKNVSNAVSKMTATAISPILVTAAFGVYNYARTPAGTRAQLPWYYSPWFIAICIVFSVVSLFASATNLINLPPQASKLVEFTEKNFGLLLTTPIVFNVITPVSELLANNVQTALAANDMYVYASIVPIEFLAALPGQIWQGIISIMMFFVYVAIWIMNTTFDIFIFLSPFGWLNTILKTIRGTYLTFLLSLSLIYPPLAFLLTLPVIIISIIMFSWSVRRVTMGFVFIRDFIFKKKKTAIDEKGILAFSEPGMKAGKKRLGRLKEEDGKWVFTYRKYFIFKKTKVIDKTESILKKGFLCSDIRSARGLICSLPPRYQKITEEVQAYLSIDKIEVNILKKGIKAVVTWVKELFSSEKELASA